MQGQVISGDPAAFFEGASIDSRTVTGGELFFALRGEHTDGLLFAEAALGSGAAAAVVDRSLPRPLDSTVIEVQDTYDALHALTRHVRSTVPRHVVGVTGSAGKTTTKDLLAAMLATSFESAASPGNLNNLYGFPVALLGIDEGSEWMVAEMGMSGPGELAQISLLARPEIAVLTNIRPVHLAAFESLRAIADAKAEILDGLRDDGTVVLNAGDAELRRIGQRLHRDRPQLEVVWYGLDEPAAGEHFPVRAVDLELAPEGEVGSRFDLVSGSARATVELALPGRHNVENCLAAATVSVLIGCDLELIAAAASAAEAAPMRGLVHDLESGAKVWDDSYNSNPDALHRALQSAAEIGSRRRWAVLGEMLELGSASEEYHRQAGRQAAELDFDPVVGIGARARELVEAARSAGTAVEWFPDVEAAKAFVAGELRSGDLLLVKGSRGVGLDALVRFLRGQ